MDNLTNINIERAVLSSILFNPELFEDVFSVLGKEDFYLRDHKSIYEAMSLCEKEKLPIDEEFLKKKLKILNEYNEEVMLEIISTSPVPNIDAYIKEIKEKSVKRKLVNLSTKISKNAQEDLPNEEIIGDIEKEIFNINSNSWQKDFRNPHEVSISTLNFIKEMQKKAKDGVVGLNTGYRDLNYRTSGFNKGDLIIIAARPSMGKTALVLNMIQKVLDSSKGVAMFSLEMPAEQLTLRMLSATTSIPLQRLRIGDLVDDEWSRLSDAANIFANQSLFIDDEVNANINKVRSKLRKLKSKHSEIELCVIDYLQLMGSTTQKERHLEVSEISRGLKILARELQIPIIALSQLNRGVDLRTDNRPLMSDIRESGSIEQDADLILFVYRDDIYKQRQEREKEKKARADGKDYQMANFDKDEEEVEIIIGKNRNGPIGTVHINFHKKFTRFVDKPKDFTSVNKTSYSYGDTKIDIPVL